MAIKLFWIYIGSFFVCSLTFLMIAKSFAGGLSINPKKPIFSGGLTAVFVSGLAFLAAFITNHLFLIYWILSGLFFIFGIIHVYFFHHKYFYDANQEKGKVIIGEILFSLGLIFFMIVIFSMLQYFLGDNKSFLFYPLLMSGVAFFLPLAFYHCFEAAINIPAPVFKTWEYPIGHEIELPDEKPNEKILVIAFEIAKRTNDLQKTNFRAKAPDTMLLGELYYFFLIDYNEQQSETPIQYAYNEYSPHEWWFRVKPKWYKKSRILNPELSIRENEIVENSIIICERIDKKSS